MSEKNPPQQLPALTNSPAEQLPVPTDASPERLPVPKYTEKSLRALVNRAQAGDEKILPELRRLLDLPGVPAIFGDLAGRVRDALLDRLTKVNLLNRELISREARRLGDELLGPAATPVERLLVEQIVVSWLQMNETTLRAAAASHIVSGNLLHRRADLVHRRFLAALRTLALIRRLAGPAVQINIAERQVNVSG